MFRDWCGWLLDLLQVVSNCEHVVAHELLEALLIVAWRNRGKFHLIGTCKSGLEESFGLLVAVIKLQEVNDREVE